VTETLTLQINQLEYASLFLLPTKVALKLWRIDDPLNIIDSFACTPFQHLDLEYGCADVRYLDADTSLPELKVI